jgi:hypothetical protein
MILILLAAKRYGTLLVEAFAEARRMQLAFRDYPAYQPIKLEQSSFEREIDSYRGV